MKKRIHLGDTVRLVGNEPDQTFEVNCFFVQKKRPSKKEISTEIIRDYWEMVQRPFLVAGGSGNYCPVALLLKIK